MEVQVANIAMIKKCLLVVLQINKIFWKITAFEVGFFRYTQHLSLLLTYSARRPTLIINLWWTIAFFKACAKGIFDWIIPKNIELFFSAETAARVCRVVRQGLEVERDRQGLDGAEDASARTAEDDREGRAEEGGQRKESQKGGTG